MTGNCCRPVGSRLMALLAEDDVAAAFALGKAGSILAYTRQKCSLNSPDVSKMLGRNGRSEGWPLGEYRVTHG